MTTTAISGVPTWFYVLSFFFGILSGFGCLYFAPAIMEFLDNVDHIVVLKDGVVAEEGSPENLLKKRQHLPPNVRTEACIRKMENGVKRLK